MTADSTEKLFDSRSRAYVGGMVNTRAPIERPLNLPFS